MSFYLALRPVAVSLVALLIVTFSGFGLLKASENTVPGHFLYTFKRVAERTQLVFAFNQSKKTALRAQILTNRLQEVKILTKNTEKGDIKAENKLNILTQKVTSEMQNLKKEVASKIINPFPDDDLLYIEDDLPIQDGRMVFTINQTEDLERLLTQTHGLLEERNLSAALISIDKAIHVSQSQEPTTEEDITVDEHVEENIDEEHEDQEIDSNENEEESSIYEEDTTKKETETEIKIKEPITDVQPSITESKLPPASTGELFQGIISTERSEEPNKEVGTGLVREK